MANETIHQLNSEHEDAIVRAIDEVWNEAIDVAAEQLHGLKDTVLELAMIWALTVLAFQTTMSFTTRPLSALLKLSSL